MEYTKRYLFNISGKYLFFNRLTTHNEKHLVGFVSVVNNYPLKKLPIELINTFKNIL